MSFPTQNHSLAWIYQDDQCVSFSAQCVHCTQSHQKCLFDTDSPLQCKRCIKLKIPCLFQLSSQGSRNDLNASTDPKDVTTMLMKSDIVVCDGQSTELDGVHSLPKPLDPNGRKDVTTMLMKSDIVVCDGRSTKLDGAHSPPKPLDPNGRSVNANESVHYARNTRMASRKAEVAEKGHQKRRKT
jgi:hypothetical protein